MQAELPDKNTAFIVYRRESISSWKSGKYDACIGALYSLMGLLPSEYRPSLSTEEFELMTTQNLMAVCTDCSAENNFAEVQTYNVILPFIAHIISGQQSEKVWLCKICSKENRLSTTKLIQKVLKEPYFLKVLPQPPGRRDGMMGRTQYKIKFSTWFWLALSSIEAQMGRYREEYQPKDTDMFDMESSVQEGGEIQ